MNDIITWLNDPKDYMVGLHLYDIHGGYKSVVTLLTNHRNPDKLINVMRDLKNKLATQPVVTHAVPKSTYLTELDKKWHPVYAEMSMYHARMAMATTDEQRRVLANKVIALENECGEYWQQRDYYIQHGESMLMPAKQLKKSTQSSQLSANDHKRLTNLRTYVSINKRALMDIEAQILVAKDETQRKRLVGKKNKKEAQLAQQQAEIKTLENETT